MPKLDPEGHLVPKAPLFHPLQRRLHMTVLMMGGFCCVQFMTVSLALTITCMVNSTAVAEHELILQGDSADALPPADLSVESEASGPQCSLKQNAGEKIIVDYGGSLVWDHTVQNFLFKGTFMGALFTVLPAMFILERWSLRLIIALSVALFSVCALSVPYIATHFNYNFVFLSRLIMGLGESFVNPGFNSLIANWFPVTERSTAIALFTTGNQLATAGGNPLAAWFCESSFGWEGVFYMSGIVGVVWSVLWFLFSSNQPSKCRVMTRRERAYLNAHCVKRSHKKEESHPIPYRAIMTSPAFLAQLQAQFFISIVFTMLQLYLPTYFKDVLLLGIMENGIYTSLPNVAMFTCKLVWSMVMDQCKEKGVLSPTQAVRLSQSMTSFGMMFSLTSLAFLVDCSTPKLALSLVTVTWCCMGCSVSGFVTSLLSIAPRYVPTMASLSMFTALLGRLAAPYGVGLLKKTGTTDEWKCIFLYAAGLVTFSGVIFLIFGSGDVQPWGQEDDVHDEDKERAEYEQELLVKGRRQTISLN